MHTHRKIYHILVSHPNQICKSSYQELPTFMWQIGKQVLTFHNFVIKVIMITLKVGCEYIIFLLLNEDILSK